MLVRRPSVARRLEGVAVGLAVSFAGSLLVLLSCRGADPSRAAVRLPPLVVVAKIATRDVPVEVRAPVDLRPLEQADVGAKTLGYLDAVLVDRGDRVKRGQVLALVRPSDLPDQLTAARGTLAQTQSSAALARTNLARAKALAPSAVISQQELQQAESQVASAEAAQDAAQAQISAVAVRLGETRIASPLTGVVTQRRLDPGALVGPPGGGTIITVARTDVLRMFVGVNERELRGLAVGKDAHVELDAMPGRSYAGKVVRLAPSLDPGTRTLDAEIQIPNPTGELRPGMYGRGAIVVEVHAGAIVVPVSAVVFVDAKPFVFVLDGDVVRRRALTTGVDGGEWFEVTAGLAAGQEVVTAGVEGLADGMKVRPARGVDPFTGVGLATTAPGSPDAGAAPPR